MRSFRVQRGVTVFGLASNIETVTLPIPTDPTRAFPRLTNVQHTDSGRDAAGAAVQNNDDFGAIITGWDGLSFTLERAAAGENADHRYYWEVWEDQTARQAEDGWYVRGLATTTMLIGQSNVLSSVHAGVENYQKCIPFPCAARSGATTRVWGDARFTTEIESTAQVRLQRDAASTAARLGVTTALVEFGSNWTIRNNLELTITGNGGDVLLLGGAGSTPWANKFFIPTLRVSDGADTISVVSYHATALAGDNDTIRVRSDPARPAVITTPTMVCHAAYHPRMAVEHRGTDQSGLPDLTGEETDVTLAAAHRPEETGTVGSTAGTGGLAYPGGHWSYALQDATTIRFRRGRTGANDASFAYQTIQLPRIPQPGGGLEVTGSAVTATALGDGLTATAHSGG